MRCRDVSLCGCRVKNNLREQPRPNWRQGWFTKQACNISQIVPFLSGLITPQASNALSPLPSFYLNSSSSLTFVEKNMPTVPSANWQALAVSSLNLITLQ